VKQRTALCAKHGYAVCSKCIVVTDAARRMSDRINLWVIGQPWDVLKNSWVAFRLNDGGTDGVLYDTREAAIRHQPDERYAAYFCMRNALGGANARDCQIFLDVHRHVYDAGGRFVDPMIMTTRGHDILSGRVDPHA
jgi:hypothetical protein